MGRMEGEHGKLHIEVKHSLPEEGLTFFWTLAINKQKAKLVL